MTIKSRNGSKISKVDIQILGGGMVGLALAYQIAKKNKDLRIQILDKEIKLGAHNSGRNSGVLHAGIYYKPGSLKAKVCVDGARRLKEWCFSEDLKVLECGKLIVTQKPDQNSDLELLFERANQNGADAHVNVHVPCPCPISVSMSMCHVPCPCTMPHLHAHVPCP